MTDGDALLAAIYHNPHDDTPRLVYADWLEENGDEARAEFIRVQCRIAALERDCSCVACVRKRGGGQHHNGPCAVDREREDLPGGRSRQSLLRYRERNLCSGHWDRWCPAAAPPPACSYGCVGPDVTVYGRRAGDVTLSFRRGFVAGVECRAEWWLAHHENLYWHPDQTVECPARCRAMRAGDDTTYESHANLVGNLHQLTRCRKCAGKGRVPRPCPPTAQPIERVTLTTWPDYADNRAYQSGMPPVVLQGLAVLWPGIVFELPERLELGPDVPIRYLPGN